MPTRIEVRKTLYCTECGCTDVYRKRIAFWSPDREEWVDEPFSDEYFCNECSAKELGEDKVYDV